jgi:hypothetical protein
VRIKKNIHLEYLTTYISATEHQIKLHGGYSRFSDIVEGYLILSSFNFFLAQLELAGK